MKKFLNRHFAIAALFTIIALSLSITPAMSHHSFAMYDQTKTITWTGVMTRFVAQANHAEMHFIPLGPDGKPMKAPNGEYIEWGVEMAGAAAMANQGVTVTTFPYRTIFSVSLNPLRDGKNFGSRTGPIYECPKDTPPAAGKHCNSVKGGTQHGRGEFRE